MKRFPGSERVVWVSCLVLVAAAVLHAAEPAEEARPAKPPWQRLLQGEDAKKAAEQEKQLTQLQQAGKFEDALKVAEALAELRGNAQGADHWQAVKAGWDVRANRQVLGQGEEARRDYAGSFALRSQGETLQNKGRYKEAQPLFEKALAISRKILGDDHPDTAHNYNNLALNLNEQIKYQLAEEHFRKALAIRRKILGEDHPDTAETYNNVAFNLNAQGKYAEAEEGYRKALAIRRKVLGEEHPDTAQSYNNLASNLSAQGKLAEAQPLFEKALAIRRKVLGEEHADTAAGYNNLALNLNAQGKNTKVQPLLEKALTIRRKVLGEEHPHTAQSYNNLAAYLNAQGKHAEAEKGLRKALAIRLKVLGEEHPDTAHSYNNVAANLNAQGKHAEAEKGLRKALAIRLKMLGEEHPDTALSYNNVAANLDAQGKYAEAGEGYRKALAILRKVLGEVHPDTALGYNNVATNLNAQGKYAEAQPLFEKALAIFRTVLGEGHFLTAVSYSNLAANLDAQGKYTKAEEVYRKTLTIRRKILSEVHPDTAQSYNNLAFNLYAQGKYPEAQPLYEKALTICRTVLGAKHPHTATSYNNVAHNLNAQGMYTEAEEDYRQALAISRKVLGEEHPDTAVCYLNLALNLNAQGEYMEAEKYWLRAADAFTKARLHLAPSGLERATKTSERSPLPAMAAVLARNGKPTDAWQRFEESLARGTWDDLSARLRRPAAEQSRQTHLTARLDRLDKLIEKTISAEKLTPEQSRQREELLTQQRQVQDELAAFARHLEDAYGPAAGKVFPRGQIQSSLPPDVALIGWLDLPGQPQADDPDGEHWAVLLRTAGPPVWVRLRGSGEKGAWTDADSRLPYQLRAALQSPSGHWQPLADQLRQQRLGPLVQHLMAGNGLPAVQRLVVLPSTALAGIPVEVIADQYTVSYAHSGTMHAHLRQQPSANGKGLFALADPVFERPIGKETPQPLPSGGVLLTMVLPGSNAHQAGLKPNDVLLRYNDKDLIRPADFKTLPELSDPSRSVPVSVWRDGQALSRPLQVRPGKLGVVIAPEPAPQALAEQRRWDRRLAVRGGDDEQWDRLPGTRFEVASLRRLFGKDQPAELLMDSDASEQRLYELARAGALGKYRYLHLATHGQVDDVFPLRSAVILSRDRLPDAKERERLLLDGQPIPDGRLTAEEVLRQWDLRCELVTLSACQTALGKYERGEGFVGFAQALVLSGSRSVCLSLWEVPDAATALLMERFYQNLLGKRAGLKAPLPKASALAEAKAWLRQLPRAEAIRRAASLSEGVERGPRKKLPPLEVPPADKTKRKDPPKLQEDRPYAHPYYWAAFVLLGDPE